MACGSLAWQARRKSSSSVRGLGPAGAILIMAGSWRARHHSPKPNSVVRSRIKLASCHGQRGSRFPFTLVEACPGDGDIRAGSAATVRVWAGSCVRSSWSVRVFHQTTSRAGRVMSPLRLGTSASRSSRLPTRLWSCTSLVSLAWSG